MPVQDERFNDEEPSQNGAADGRAPPPTRQHKYSTADMKPERPWKRWCLTLLTCLVCIAIMILITILMQKLFDPPEDEDWSDDAVNATDDDIVGTPGALSGTAATLPKSMAFIEDVCDETRVGRDDTAACESACEPAKDCCNPYAGGGNSTCFEQEPSGCFAYSKCHSLSGFFDPAHNDLDRICNKASLEVDPTECIEACKSLSCCYLKEESCVAKHFQACLDYAPCQNLKVDSIDVAPMDLDETCENASPTCKRACREATCCGDPNSKCYREDFVSCMSYSACTGKSDITITVAPIYSRMEPAPDIMEDVCSEKGIAEFGVAKCVEACTPAQCCWEDGAGGCFGDDPLGCLEYGRCTILQTPEYAGVVSFPPVPSTPKEPAATESAAAPEASPTEGNETEATEAPTAASSESPGRIRG